MLGPTILARTISVPTRTDRYGNRWQYHSRSDHHSKVACWCILFDLLQRCTLLRQHVSAGKVAFGINHEMRDFQHDRKKNLDLVLCAPGSGRRSGLTMRAMARDYRIVLSPDEAATLDALPDLPSAPVGSVLLALEAKACMTAHQRALPRLYDELNSSHLTVHGATDHAIAAGFVMVNVGTEYLSPDLNKADLTSSPQWSRHNQPRDAQLAIDKVRQIPRRSKIGIEGYDALAIAVIECRNDSTPVRVVTEPPAPQPGDIYEYSSMIHRLDNIYSTRFGNL